MLILYSIKHPPIRSGKKYKPEIVLFEIPGYYGPEQALADLFSVNDSLYQVLFSDSMEH